MIARAETNFAIPVIESVPRGGSITAIEMGMAWFPEQPGGMDRYFFDLIGKIKSANVNAQRFSMRITSGGSRFRRSGSCGLPKRCSNGVAAVFDPQRC